jgi:hypothetical protein
MPTDAVDLLVVHHGFRREFAEMPALISAAPAGDTARARVIGAHVVFMGWASSCRHGTQN